MIMKHTLAWLFGIALITLTVLYLGWEEISRAIGHADAWIILFLALLQLFTLTISAYQWKFLIAKSNCSILLGRILLIFLAGNYVESVTPSVKFGGETAKIYLFHQQTSFSYTKLGGILLALKYYSLLPFLVISALVLGLAVLRYQLPAIAVLAFIILLLIFAMIAWMHHKGGSQNSVLVNQTNEESFITSTSEQNPNHLFQQMISLFKKKFKTLVSFINRASAYSRSMATPLESYSLMGMSALIWGLYPLKVYLVTYMLGFEVDLVTVSIATFTAYLVSMVPLLPGGLGSFEGSMVLMFSISGLTPVEGLTVALLSRLITYWFPLILSAAAAVYLSIIYKSLRPGEEEQPQNRKECI